MYQWAPAMAINRKALLPTIVLAEVLLFCRCLIYLYVSTNVYTMHVHAILMPAKLQGEQNHKQGSSGIMCIWKWWWQSMCWRAVLESGTCIVVSHHFSPVVTTISNASICHQCWPDCSGCINFSLRSMRLMLTLCLPLTCFVWNSTKADTCGTWDMLHVQLKSAKKAWKVSLQQQQKITCVNEH